MNENAEFGFGEPLGSGALVEGIPGGLIGLGLQVGEGKDGEEQGGGEAHGSS